MIKTLLRSFAALALLLASGIAAATVYSVNETYASGAVFNGTLTFQANGQLVSGNGTLTGAGHNNDFGWIYGGSPTFGIPQGANQGYTWLVDNSSQWGILIDWNYADPSQLAFITTHNGVYNGPVIDSQNVDHAVSSNYSRVPEPASLALMAAGLFGLTRVRKVRAKS